MNPLEQLQDIALPEKIHGFPVALGWWLLAVLMCALVIFLVVYLVKSHLQRKCQKAALKQLDSQTLTVEESLALLKWSCLQYFSRQDVAALYGENFQQFLTSKLLPKHQEHFNQLSEPCFIGLYQAAKTESTGDRPSIENNNLTATTMAQFWLKNALPPKEKSTGKNTQRVGQQQ